MSGGGVVTHRDPVSGLKEPQLPIQGPSQELEDTQTHRNIDQCVVSVNNYIDKVYCAFFLVLQWFFWVVVMLHRALAIVQWFHSGSSGLL